MSDESENIYFDVILSKTNCISIVILYKPPNHNRFLDDLSKGLNGFILMENNLFILSDTNINNLDTSSNILNKCKYMSKGKYNFGAIRKLHA